MNDSRRWLTRLGGVGFITIMALACTGIARRFVNFLHISASPWSGFTLHKAPLLRYYPTGQDRIAYCPSGFDIGGCVESHILLKDSNTLSAYDSGILWPRSQSLCLTLVANIYFSCGHCELEESACNRLGNRPLIPFDSRAVSLDLQSSSGDGRMQACLGCSV